MEWESVESHQFTANLPLGGLHDFHAGFGVVTGRSSDSQACRLSGRNLYWPIFPVLEKTSDNWVFDPAYRCGAVPDLHRVPF